MSDSLFSRGKRQETSLEYVQQTAPLFARSPFLYDCLKSTSEPGTKKLIKGCTIRLGFYLADVQVCVTDDVNGLYAYAILDPFKALDEALEEVLSSPLNWQDSRGKRK